MRHTLAIRAAPTALVLLLAAATLTGCTAPRTSEVSIPEAEYARAFDIAKQVLRDSRFDLERVDARAGVISTSPKETTGILTPWETEQQTAGQELEDMIQHQQRVVRLTFEPVDGPGMATQSSDPDLDPSLDPAAADPAAAFVDLLGKPADTRLRVQVVLQRINRPLWRVDSTTVRFSNYAVDPDLVQRGMQPQYEVSFAEDRDFADRLAQRIREKLAAAR